MKHILRSRTVWFSIALAVLSVLQGSVHLFALSPIGQMWAGIGIAAAVALLRAVTTQPLGSPRD